MPDNAKPQPEKKKRGRAVKHDPLWQLQEPSFERHYWWMIPLTKADGETSVGKDGKPVMTLNKEHPELAPEFDAKSRDITRAAPIVWEVLRRHEDVAKIRKTLTEFLPGEGGEGKWTDEVLRKFGFEIEFMLAASGLNAWQSRPVTPRDYLKLKKGAWPLREASRLRFEQLMDAYRHQSRADKPDNWWMDLTQLAHHWWMDLTQLAHQMATSQHRLTGTKPRKANSKDPFSIFTEDADELEMLKSWIANARRSGQRLAVIAHEQTGIWYPSEEAPRFDEDDNLRFLPGHINDLSELVRKLKDQDDRVSNYLWGRLSECTREKIESFDEIDEMPYEQIHSLLRTLCHDLNAVLSGPCIYDEDIFKFVKLTANTMKLRTRKPRGENLVRLNRLLLEAAYDWEIVKSSTLGNSAAEREFAVRRPKPEQLVWVYQVENGNDTHRSDFNRMLDGVEFPLLPCEADPKCKDELTARLKRLCARLGEIPMGPDSVK